MGWTISLGKQDKCYQHPKVAFNKLWPAKALCPCLCFTWGRAGHSDGVQGSKLIPHVPICHSPLWQSTLFWWGLKVNICPWRKNKLINKFLKKQACAVQRSLRSVQTRCTSVGCNDSGSLQGERDTLPQVRTNSHLMERGLAKESSQIY